MKQYSITTLIKLPFEAALRETNNTLAEEEFVRVRPHLCDEVQAVLGAFCTGRLRLESFPLPGCQHACGCQRREKSAAARKPQPAISFQSP